MIDYVSPVQLDWSHALGIVLLQLMVTSVIKHCADIISHVSKVSLTFYATTIEYLFRMFYEIIGEDINRTCN